MNFYIYVASTVINNTRYAGSATSVRATHLETRVENSDRPKTFIFLFMNILYTRVL